MINKIIAIIIAISLVLSVLCIPVSADSLIGANIDFTGSMMSSYADFFKDYLSALLSYYKGDMSLDELNDTLDSIVENRNDDLDANLQNLIDRINDIIKSGGSLSDVTDNILDFLKNIGVLVEIDETVENVDMRGYGVMLVTTHKDTGLKYTYWGATYAVWDPERNQCRFVSDDGIVVYGGFSDWWKERAFENKKNSPHTTSLDGTTNASYLTYQWYGDVRIGDPFDTSNDDNLPSGDSSDPEEDVTTDNTDGLTDEDIIKLLEELLEKLQIEFPDLSTLEGLLEAIYHRLGTLDSDNDGALLAQINTAIMALVTSEAADSVTTQKMLETLIEIRDTVTGEGEKDSNIKGTLYNCYPVEHYSNFFTRLFGDTDKLQIIYLDEVYDVNPDGTVNYPKDSEDKYYIDMNYEATSEMYLNVNTENNVDLDFDYSSLVIDIDPDLSDSQKALLNSVVSVVKTLVAFLPYKAVTQVMNTVQNKIYVNGQPADITFTINSATGALSSMNGTYVLLSSSILTDYADTIKIIKDFLSIVILYLWLLKVRKKTITFFGGAE